MLIRIYPSNISKQILKCLWYTTDFFREKLYFWTGMGRGMIFVAFFRLMSHIFSLPPPRLIVSFENFQIPHISMVRILAQFYWYFFWWILLVTFWILKATRFKLLIWSMPQSISIDKGVAPQKRNCEQEGYGQIYANVAGKAYKSSW